MIKVMKVVKEIKQCFCNGCEKLIADEYDENFDIYVEIAQYSEDLHICSECQHKISQYIKTAIRSSILDGEFKKFLDNNKNDSDFQKLL